MRSGTNTTVWNTAGNAGGRYWLCLDITWGKAVTSAYAGGVLAVAASAAPSPNPVGAVDLAALDPAEDFGVQYGKPAVLVRCPVPEPGGQAGQFLLVGEARR